MMNANLPSIEAALSSSLTRHDNRCAVLIPSCDAYSDLWRPFFTLFSRHWPDCPFPVYLGSNQQAFEHPRVTTIQVGHDYNWANGVRAQIAALDTPYVLLMLEDFFLRRPVNTAQILSCLDTLAALKGKMLRLVRRPPPDLPVAGFPLIGKIKPGAPYRVSTQATLWRRGILLDLMRENETIWQFEIHGSQRSDAMGDGFYSVWRSVLPYDHHVLERGKWFRHEAWRFGRMEVGCDFARRQIMTRWEMLRWLSRKCPALLLGVLPWEQRQRLLRFLRPIALLGQQPENL